MHRRNRIHNTSSPYKKKNHHIIMFHHRVHRNPFLKFPPNQIHHQCTRITISSCTTTMFCPICPRIAPLCKRANVNRTEKLRNHSRCLIFINTRRSSAKETKRNNNHRNQKIYRTRTGLPIYILVRRKFLQYPDKIIAKVKRKMMMYFRRLCINHCNQ